jgi:hypothetical protein
MKKENIKTMAECEPVSVTPPDDSARALLAARIAEGTEKMPKKGAALWYPELTSAVTYIKSRHVGLHPFGALLPPELKARIDDQVAAYGESKAPTPTPTPLAGEVIPAEELVEAAPKLSALIKEADAAARAVANQLGYLLPANSTEPGLICRDIAANMRRSVESCLEMGKGLLVLKAACGHGAFMAHVAQIGLSIDLAGRLMTAARKISNSATLRNLLPHVDSQCKFLELFALDTEQLKDLVETGQTGELALDDVACMGVSELRKKLREVRAKNDAKDKLIALRDKEIAEKIEALEVSQKPVDSAKSDDILREISEAQDEVSRSLFWLQTRLALLRKSLGVGPRYLSLTHAELEKSLGMIRQVAVNLNMPLAMTPDDPTIDDAEAIDDAWAHVDAEIAAEQAAADEAYDNGDD